MLKWDKNLNKEINMCKMTKFILKNFNLNEDDLKHVPAIVAEIQQEIEDGNYDDAMNNVCGAISEYTLYDVFDEKLFDKSC